MADLGTESSMSFGAKSRDGIDRSEGDGPPLDDLDIQISKPPAKINITFEGLSYGVKPDKGSEESTKWLLKDVTGSITPGQMCALMGPSGAGKSTLLDVLACRKTSGQIEGDLLFNGRPFRREMKRWFGYVEQRDILMGTLTVREMLFYTARLRLPAHGLKNADDLAVANDRVDEVIRQLGLEKCADVVIGTPLRRGVSGGQAKRVNAGMELITNPSILFLDEPTSGLDSAISLDFMRVIKRICNSGVTIICTIHQPSIDLYALFDRLLLLVSGEIVYLGDAQKAVPYFESLGFRSAPHENPADFLVAVTAANRPAIETEEVKSWPHVEQSFWAEQYRKSALSSARKESTIRVRELGEAMDLVDEGARQYANGFLYTTYILVTRNFVGCWRDPGFLRKRVFVVSMIAILLMSCYWDSPHNQQGIRNRQSLIQLTIMFFSMSFNGLIAGFIEDRVFVNREVNAASYRMESYYFSLIIFELPWCLLKGAIWTALLYYPVGMNPGFGHLVAYYLMMVLVMDLGLAMAMTAAFTFPTAEISAMVMATLPNIFSMFSGFFIKRPDIPVYWLWLFYISYTNYGITAFLFNEFDGNDTYCVMRTWTGEPFTNGIERLCNGTLLSDATLVVKQQYEVIIPGRTLLIENFGVPASGFQSEMWQSVLMLMVWWFCIRVLSFVAMKFIKYGRN